MSAEEIKQKMAEYSGFVTEKLRPEYQAAAMAFEEAKAEIDSYRELSQRLDNIQKDDAKQLTTMVDLGYQTVYCNAEAKLDTIFVHVGMGFHAELTIHEAIQFVRKRISFLTTDVKPGKKSRVKEISDHMASATAILDELDRELQRATR